MLYNKGAGVLVSKGDLEGFFSPWECTKVRVVSCRQVVPTCAVFLELYFKVSYRL